MAARIPRLSPGTRTTLCGRSGSGKSTFAVWLLRGSRQKWVLIDPKVDDKIATLRPAYVHDLDAEAVHRAWAAGAQYVSVCPPPGTDAEAVDFFLLELFETVSNFGVYVDELYYINRNGKCFAGLQAILTRGRSDKVTFLGCTQRPAFVCGFCFSEVNALLQMQLNMEADRKRIFSFTGNKIALDNPDPYALHCHYADGEYTLVRMVNSSEPSKNADPSQPA